MFSKGDQALESSSRETLHSGLMTIASMQSSVGMTNSHTEPCDHNEFH
jgi:hypothetical protein